MVKKIRLMADYGCDPLWGEDADNIGDIDPITLPISQDTINRLSKWVKAYDATLNQDYPPDSDFSSPEEAEAFDREGVNLWLQLQKELAPEYEVYYFSDRLQKLFTHPSEIELLVSRSM
ncbi:MULTISPECIES: hypothetical protein [Kamptonema]|uniref:hypothetical protein n=1 Tax=Kamptonema TaxID=1501433 RepID=UPI0001DAC75D|nr:MULTISPECIES: hypothetical protein [Kamptonema]CBN58573.1 conserved hypothetical protein [Kamptonema sp. PCC 6506]